MDFAAALEHHFPGAMLERELIARSYQALLHRGFTDDNTIAIVGACRDELCRPLMDGVAEAWGEAFDIAGLAGFPFGGKTAITAALHHAPDGDRARYLFVVFAHTALDAAGTPGRYHRPGQDHPSSACGALAGFRAELELGEVPVELDLDDVEQSLLRHKLLTRLPYGRVPGLLELTRVAHAAIVDDLERLIEATVDPDYADWAVITGIQVHGPEGTWAWPGAAWSVVDGARVHLDF